MGTAAQSGKSLAGSFVSDKADWPHALLRRDMLADPFLPGKGGERNQGIRVMENKGIQVLPPGSPKLHERGAAGRAGQQVQGCCSPAG